MKTWWINNSWRFWAFRWVWVDDSYQAVEMWREYRYMLNPDDDRSLSELIIEEYEADVDRAVFSNSLLRFILWLQRTGRNLRSLAKIEPPF